MALNFEVKLSGPLDFLIPMILEFAQKSFPTQYLLPFYRFERIFNLTNQPFFHPATILPSLPAPTGIGLEGPLNRFTVQERFPFLQPGVSPVAALVSCPRNTRYFAGGQLAVFQGGPSRTGGEAPISLSYGSSEQRGKTANWPRPRGLR